MAISASSIASSSTLNELRTQFNNLVTDVTAIEGGSISYTTLNTTTTNATTLNVKEDGTIVFEGATDDAYETTLTVVDPTADRTITFPNETGTVHTSGGTTTHTAIVVADAGNIGSASDTDAISIGSDGDITLTQDLELQHDGAILSFGANDEIALTHVHDTGLLLTDSGGSPTLQLHDANESVSSDGSKLILTSNGTAFNLPTSDGTSGQALITDGSGNFSFTTVSANTPSSADGQALGSASLEWSDLFLADGGTVTFGNDQEIVLTHVADTGLTLKHASGSDDSAPTFTLQTGDTDIASNDLLGAIQFQAPDEGTGTDAILVAAGIDAISEGDFSSSSNATRLRFLTASSETASEKMSLSSTGVLTLNGGSGSIVIPNAGNIGSASDTDAIAIGSDGDVTLTQDLELQHDGAILSFGANDEIALTHVHDTGLLLTDSGGSPTLQFHDSNEAVSSDGSKLILTSGGTAFSLPTSDGSSGQFLKTNGSAVLSFDTVSSAADDITAGDAAINITTTSGNITIDAQANDSDVIIKGTDATADITMATFDGSDAGTLILNHDLELGTDAALIKFGADNEITLTHVADTGLLLEDSGGSPTLQFHNSSESVSSDGSKLILTSNGVAFSLPTADGSNTQVLQTNGSGVLSFTDSSASVAFNAYEYTATQGQTSFSGSDDNSATLAYTAGVNNVQVLVNGIMLDSSDYTATNGTAVVLSSGAHVSDMVKIVAVQSTNVASADLDGAEFVLDADGDTSLRANTDDQIDVKIGGAIDFAFKANSFEVASGSNIDMNGTELILDADADTSITADTDDQIDIRIAGADDFRFTANSFNVLSGSTLTVDSGATITNSGTANGFGLSTGKTIVFAMLFGS